MKRQLPRRSRKGATMKCRYKEHVNTKVKATIVKETEKAYEEIKREHEEKLNDRFCFMFLLATADFAHEAFGFGPIRRERLLKGITQRVNEISSYLTSNVVTEANNREKHFDIEYNRDYLRRLADQYGIEFDETIFDDEF